MAVYVDDLVTYHGDQIAKKAKKFGKRWCHMWADSEEELHKAADKLGLKKEWCQKGSLLTHYDLVPSKRTEALKSGITKKSLKEWFREKKNRN